MNLDKVMIIFNGVFIKDFKYSINDKKFYYGVLTAGGDDLVYEYSKKENEEIIKMKEEEILYSIVRKYKK